MNQDHESLLQLPTLPQDWAAEITRFYCFHSELFKAPLAITTRLRMWREQYDLTFQEVKAVFARLSTPHQCSRFAYSGQLLAAMAEEVAEEVRNRASRQQQAAAREQHERERQGAAPAEEIKKLLAQRFNPNGVQSDVRDG